MFIEILLVIVALIFAIYKYYTWNNDYWKKCGIPYEEPEFFFGNFKDVILGKEAYGLLFSRAYKKFANSPFIGMFNIREPLLVVRDLDIIKQVLSSSFANFSDTDFTVDLEKDIIWATNPFSNKGEMWKTVRSKWAPHFSPAKLKLTFERLTEVSEKLTEHLNAMAIKKEPVKLREMASTFFLDYIIYGVFGIKNDSFADPKNVFMEVKESIFTSSYIEALINISFAIFPSLAKLFAVRFVSKSIEKNLLNVCKNIIKSRNETGQPNTDMYETLQKFSLSEGKQSFSQVDVAGRLFGIILDGSETTSNPTSLGIYEVAANPEIQNRLRKEIDEAYARSANGKLSFEELDALPYLDMIFSEILRIYVPIFQFPRVCTKDIVLEAQGFKVPVKRGMRVIVPVFGVHNDPKYFPDPLKFDPERFSPESREKLPKFAYMPFGEGPRMCVGRRMGIMEAKLLMVTMVRNFEMTPAVTLPRPLTYDPNIFVPRSLIPASVYLTPRKKQ